MKCIQIDNKSLWVVVPKTFFFRETFSLAVCYFQKETNFVCLTQGLVLKAVSIISL